MKLPLWLQKLLGGRPMLRVGETFRDCRLQFIDCRGRMWLAYSSWSFFRQRVGQDWEDEKKRREEQERFLNSEGRIGSFYDLGGD